MLRIPGWRLVLAAPLMLILTVPACTSSAPPEHVSVTARPGTSAGDQAVHFEVTGLRPGQQAALQVTSTDARGVPWSSAATYRADAGGVVDPDRAAPLSGGYHGVSGMGPVWSLHESHPAAAGASNELAYFWSADKSFTFTVTVRVDGVSVAAPASSAGSLPSR